MNRCTGNGRRFFIACGSGEGRIASGHALRATQGMAGKLLAGISLRVQVAFLGMAMGAIALPIAFMMMFGRAEPIARDAVFGCYTTMKAPSLEIREDAIHIMEPARRTLQYVAEASKTSYQLHVRPALALNQQADGGYAFVPTQGIGFFWPLLPEEGMNRNRVRHPQEYAGRFEILAADGSSVIYTRTSRSDACR